MPRQFAIRIILGLLATTGGACVPTQSDQTSGTSTTTTTGEDGNVGLDPNLFPGNRIAGEPNDDFSVALDAILDSAGGGQLQGSIEDVNDVDVYNLGPMTAGDRVIVDATGSSTLDADIALFDDADRLLFENDDRNYDLQQYDPFVNHVLRHDTTTCYLAICTSPFNESVGQYEMLITVTRGGTVPDTIPQTVVLNFVGGTITIPGDTTYTVGTFDTADISSRYAGMTSQVRDRIRTRMLENYDGLNLDVLSLPSDSAPTNTSYSQIYFGGRNTVALGIAQAIDPYNADQSDNAIVFTDVFTPSRFGRVLTADELGDAIGNVAAHELGHLLGLNHVDNIYDLMDTTGGMSTLLLDQDFMTSSLDDTIFPIGNQSGLLLLQETLGIAAQ